MAALEPDLVSGPRTSERVAQVEESEDFRMCWQVLLWDVKERSCERFSKKKGVRSPKTGGQHHNQPPINVMKDTSFEFDCTMLFNLPHERTFRKNRAWETFFGAPTLGVERRKKVTPVTFAFVYNFGAGQAHDFDPPARNKTGSCASFEAPWKSHAMQKTGELQWSWAACTHLLPCKSLVCPQVCRS